MFNWQKYNEVLHDIIEKMEMKHQVFLLGGFTSAWITVINGLLVTHGF